MTLKQIALLAALALAIAGCDKYGGAGSISHAFGNWAQVNLPAGCVARQLAAEESGGVAVLCEDGRIFH